VTLNTSTSKSDLGANSHSDSTEPSSEVRVPQESVQPALDSIERRRKLPSAIRSQIERVSPMPGIPPRDYFELFVSLAEATGAKSVIEYTSVLDVTVATQEIQFYRRMKPLVIERFRQERVQNIADQDLAAQQTVVEAQARGRPDLFPEAKRIAARQKYDGMVGEVEGFLASMLSLDRIDELIDAATGRRNAALHAIEQQQRKFAEKLRVVSASIIEGKVTSKSDNER
jgi:hypothetical protein